MQASIDPKTTLSKSWVRRALHCGSSKTEYTYRGPRTEEFQRQEIRIRGCPVSHAALPRNYAFKKPDDNIVPLLRESLPSHTSSHAILHNIGSLRRVSVL